MTVELGILISLSGIAFTSLSFFLGQRSAAKIEGEKQGALLAELQNIKENLQELKKDFKQINVEKIHSELNSLRERQDKFGKSINRVHDRIDNHLHKEHRITTERLGDDD